MKPILKNINKKIFIITFFIILIFSSFSCNTTTIPDIPIQNSIKQLKISGNTTFAITTNNILYGFGENDKGQIGNGNTSNVYMPTVIMQNVSNVNINDKTTCAIKTNGDLYCWGDNSNKKIDKESNKKTITKPIKILDNVSNVTIDFENIIAIKTNGDMYVFGKFNQYLDSSDDSNEEDDDDDNNKNFINLNKKDLEIFDDQTSSSESSSESGSQDSSESDSTSENTSSDEPEEIEDIFLQNVTYSYIIKNKVYYLAADNNLYVTDNTRKSKGMFGRNVESIIKGKFHDCIITINKDLFCAGKNIYGELGIGNKRTNYSYTKVLSNVKKVSLGDNHTCAVTYDNKLYCFGQNIYGQLGLQDTNDVTRPMLILENVKNVSAKINTTCAVMTNGNLYCFGQNSYGQTQINVLNEAITTKPILRKVQDIKLGYNHACTILIDNRLYCFGDNSYGQIGKISIKPAKIFDGSGAKKDIKNPCKNHWNSKNIGKSCDNSLSNSCLARGIYTCYNSISNPSIVCKTTTPSCCEDENFVLIGSKCPQSGEYKNQGKYICDGFTSYSKVKCNINNEYIDDENDDEGDDDDNNKSNDIEEFCNGIDDNNNGIIDEGFFYEGIAVGNKCSNPLGEATVQCIRGIPKCALVHP